MQYHISCSKSCNTLHNGKYYFKSLSNLLLNQYVCDISNVVFVLSRTVSSDYFLSWMPVFILSGNMILSASKLIYCGRGRGGTVSYVVQRTFISHSAAFGHMCLCNYKTQTGFEICLNEQVLRFSVWQFYWQVGALTITKMLALISYKCLTGLQVWWHSLVTLSSIHSFTRNVSEC